LHENKGKNIFVHCRLGDDRTAMMVAASPTRTTSSAPSLAECFHGDNTGSNPAGDAKPFQQLGGTATVFRPQIRDSA